MKKRSNSSQAYHYVTKTALRSFWVSYQRDFIPWFTEAAKPLYDLTKEEVPDDKLPWTGHHTAAMEALKTAVAQATSLISPNPSALFHLKVATTARALSDVLS
ncbi:UNVERIFIED_CONTAM: hypothetical protein FKN15_002886 [Acipenser sinensis]